MVDRCSLGIPLSLLTLALTLHTFTLCQSGKSSYIELHSLRDLIRSCFLISAACITETAQVGQRLVLECKIYCPNTDNGFTWRGDDVLKTNYSINYIVTESVTVTEYGGQNYSCECQSNGNTECFTVCGVFTVLNFLV